MQIKNFGIFGEVLFDRFADGHQVLGGAPFNVAWHLQAFGQKPLFISRVGRDAAGDEIRAAMHHWGMCDAGIQIDPEYPTGSVAVTLQNGEPCYSILDNQAYDFINPAELPVFTCRMLYHGSLALRHEVSAQALDVLKSRRLGKVFIDVNLRQPWWQIDTLKSWIIAADWLKLNDQELQQLLPGEQPIADKMHKPLHEYQLQGLIITCGRQGAMALCAEGDVVQVVPEDNITIVDTVGAGDAFSAVMLLGIHQDWPLTLTLQRAQNFASALLEQTGATVQDRAFYQNFVSEWA